jgi:prepilin-type N-terminal cleavage/methylation domain-containing protein
MHPKIYLFKKEGFTLIKIMASLVIIGVLALVGRYQNNVCHEANVDK